MAHYLYRGLVAMLLLCTCTLGPLTVSAQDSGSANQGYLAITGPCHLHFPQDHGSHPGYRTEWWYYTGNLSAAGGELYGFQLTFFRRQISPPDAAAAWPQPPSPWRTQQLYLAHAAISDISGKTFYHAERIARSARKLAGAEQNDGSPCVFLGNWMARLGSPEQRLTVVADDFGYDLSLQPEKSPIPHGDQGYSRKGSTPERASCYYSFTRLQASGVLVINGKEYPVQGNAWMDHEFSSAPLEPGIAGWDWFSLQLPDRSELMIYRLRRQDGTTVPASSGTYVDASGRATHLPTDAFTLDILDHWTSPHSGARYPARWRLTIPALNLDLEIRPNLADQEMRTPETTRVTYWEGSVAVTGTSRGAAITGRGYVELTGYDRPFDAPL
jgi:predicted secreted hydrolase